MTLFVYKIINHFMLCKIKNKPLYISHTHLTLTITIFMLRSASLTVTTPIALGAFKHLPFLKGCKMLRISLVFFHSSVGL